ncbi:3'-5' exonuclease [Actinokineospora terrae]|uniref:Exonuclease n=1 Tax=Actinokineospora terrae TaxID=155974 RepID=A0A1H9T6U2_9PSEU|nr:3'-5' exonuclease [Actinokineospora terrae]SER92868.1 Exonuclease [Actinokineospora terrae]
MTSVYRDEVPEHLMTMGQLRRIGREPAVRWTVDGWLARESDDDLWYAPLYDVRLALRVPTSSSSRVEGQQWAASLLRDPNAVVLDTELTDFHGRVIEIAVVASDGTVLLGTLVNPGLAPMNPQAQRKHKITTGMLANAPTIRQVWPQLDSLLRGKLVIAWNASFDQSRLRAEHHHVHPGVAEPDWLARPWQCAMLQHAEWAFDGTSGARPRRHRLEGGHRAVGDCQAVWTRIREMAGSCPAPPGRVPAPGLDLFGLRSAWPEIQKAAGKRRYSLAGLLSQADVIEANRHTVVLTHPQAVIADRLATAWLPLIEESFTEVFGPADWIIRVEAPPKGESIATAGDAPLDPTLVRWRRSGKLHITLDGILTVCGSEIIPETAETLNDSTNWPERVRCYNCAYRHTPPGYHQPASSRDFPLRKQQP